MTSVAAVSEITLPLPGAQAFEFVTNMSLPRILTGYLILPAVTAVSGQD